MNRSTVFLSHARRMFSLSFSDVSENQLRALWYLLLLEKSTIYAREQEKIVLH